MKTLIYSEQIEAQMCNFYNSLSEKDRRRYAAVESIKLGRGGDTFICQILHCDGGIITRGKQELMTDFSSEEPRIRKPGGGRKSVLSNRLFILTPDRV
jgi:hypothetical protein